MKLIYESESRSEIRYANGKCLSAEVRTEETEQWVNKKIWNISFYRHDINLF